MKTEGGIIDTSSLPAVGALDFLGAGRLRARFQQRGFEAEGGGGERDCLTEITCLDQEVERDRPSSPLSCEPAERNLDMRR